MVDKKAQAEQADIKARADLTKMGFTSQQIEALAIIEKASNHGSLSSVANKLADDSKHHSNTAAIQLAYQLERIAVIPERVTAEIQQATATIINGGIDEAASRLYNLGKAERTRETEENKQPPMGENSQPVILASRSNLGAAIGNEQTSIRLLAQHIKLGLVPVKDSSPPAKTPPKPNHQGVDLVKPGGK